MTEKIVEIEKQEEQTELDRPVQRIRRTVKPRINLYEVDEVIMLVVDLPGVKEQDIEITLEKDRLSIYGAVKDRAPGGYRRVYSELCHGDFERSFVMSNEIDRDNIEASYDSGVLTVSLPKAETARARKIALKSTN
jgi:HSP20 family molecular chaperone IbpA